MVDNSLKPTQRFKKKKASGGSAHLVFRDGSSHSRSPQKAIEEPCLEGGKSSFTSRNNKP